MLYYLVFKMYNAYAIFNKFNIYALLCNEICICIIYIEYPCTYVYQHTVTFRYILYRYAIDDYIILYILYYLKWH